MLMLLLLLHVLLLSLLLHGLQASILCDLLAASSFGASLQLPIRQACLVHQRKRVRARLMSHCCAECACFRSIHTAWRPLTGRRGKPALPPAPPLTPIMGTTWHNSLKCAISRPVRTPPAWHNAPLHYNAISTPMDTTWHNSPWHSNVHDGGIVPWPGCTSPANGGVESTGRHRFLHNYCWIPFDMT